MDATPSHDAVTVGSAEPDGATPVIVMTSWPNESVRPSCGDPAMGVAGTAVSLLMSSDAIVQRRPASAIPPTAADRTSSMSDFDVPAVTVSLDGEMTTLPMGMRVTVRADDPEGLGLPAVPWLVAVAVIWTGVAAVESTPVTVPFAGFTVAFAKLALDQENV